MFYLGVSHYILKRPKNSRRPSGGIFSYKKQTVFILFLSVSFFPSVRSAKNFRFDTHSDDFPLYFDEFERF